MYIETKENQNISKEKKNENNKICKALCFWPIEEVY